MTDPLVPGTLKSLLETINGLEGLELEYAGDCVRGAFECLQDAISKDPEYQTNKDLARLDVVFTMAGWDDQGLRLDDEGAVRIVHFENAKHTKWTSA